MLPAHPTTCVAVILLVPAVIATSSKMTKMFEGPATCASPFASKGDFLHAGCGSSCKAENATKQCQWCRCKACPFCTDQLAGAVPVQASPPVVQQPTPTAKMSQQSKTGGPAAASKPAAKAKPANTQSSQRKDAKATTSSQLSPSKLRCYASKDVTLVDAYCSGNATGKCDLNGLQAHWTKTGSLSMKAADLSCPLTPEQLRCYALRHRESLLVGFCKGDVSQCDLAGLQWHWSNEGEKQGLSHACLLAPERLRCYALNHPDLYKGYCSKDYDMKAKCDEKGLDWHWYHVGSHNAFDTQCSSMPDAALHCYAMKNPDLSQAYCAGHAAEGPCDTAGLRWHFNTARAKEKRKFCSLAKSSTS